MKAEDVDLALVEKARQEIYERMPYGAGGASVMLLADQMARAALAAVLPEIQAQARRDAGAELANDGMQQFDPVPAWAIRYLKHATTTEEPTDG